MKEETQNKSSRIDRGWQIMKSAWQVLKLDKELAAIALISILVLPIVLIAGGILGLQYLPDQSYTTDSFSFTPAATAVWLATLAVIYIISTYTTAALVAAALKRFRGEDPTLKDGLSAVRARAGSLTLFALFNMGIGQALGFIESRLPFVAGRALAFLANIAWTVANIFSVPVIVESKEPIYPVKTVKQSVGILRRTWAESAVSQISMGLFFGLLVLLQAVILGGATAIAYDKVPGVFTAGIALLGGLGILATITVASALSGIVKAALYHYATTGDAPEHFSKELMQEAFTAKKARKIFS